jgi:hypothetical protein
VAPEAQVITVQHQRREFNKIQDKYEDLVSRYASQSKTKEPSSLREVLYLKGVAHFRTHINCTRCAWVMFKHQLHIASQFPPSGLHAIES